MGSFPARPGGFTTHAVAQSLPAKNVVPNAAFSADDTTAQAAQTATLTVKKNISDTASVRTPTRNTNARRIQTALRTMRLKKRRTMRILLRASARKNRKTATRLTAIVGNTSHTVASAAVNIAMIGRTADGSSTSRASSVLASLRSLRCDLCAINGARASVVGPITLHGTRCVTWA